jgi:hypothetical protein
MVFLIQKTQNRDTETIHLKLDELIRVTKGARNMMLDLEHMDDESRWLDLPLPLKGGFPPDRKKSSLVTKSNKFNHAGPSLTDYLKDPVTFLYLSGASKRDARSRVARCRSCG